MSKNRRKNLRDITYGDKTYKWMVDMAGPEGDQKRIRILDSRGGDGAVVSVQVSNTENTVLFEDFLTTDTVSPGDVAFIIESIIVNR